MSNSDREVKKQKKTSSSTNPVLISVKSLSIDVNEETGNGSSTSGGKGTTAPISENAVRPSSAGASSSAGDESKPVPIIDYKRFTRESLQTLNLKEIAEKERLRKRLRGRGGEGRLVDGELRFDNDDDDTLERDPALVEGHVLPEEQYGTCPKNLYGRPLEEIDKFIKHKTFVVINTRISKRYIYRFSAAKSVFLLPPWSPIRELLLYITTTQWFDYIIMLTIIVNCGFLTQTSSPDAVEYVFLAIYSLEAVLKILARGFVLEKHTYLRDGWNWLDFLVILLGYFTILLTAFQISALSGIAGGFKTLRVLRALKTISVFPGLKTIVNALLRSMRMIAEVLTLILFCMMVFALFGIQIYMGVLHNKCVKVVDWTVLQNLSFVDQYYEQYIRNTVNWEPDSNSNWYRMCGNVSGAGVCSPGYVCLADIGPNPDGGYTSYDHFGWAMLASFQLITLDFWENLYNMVIRTGGPWNILYFILIVFFGSYYLVNLMLAVVTMSYEEEALNDGKWVAYMKYYAEKKKSNKSESKKVPTVSEQVADQDKTLNGDTQITANKDKERPATAKKRASKVGPIKQDSLQSNDTAISSSHGSLQTPRQDGKKALNKHSSDLDKNNTPVDSGLGSTKDISETLQDEEEENAQEEVEEEETESQRDDANAVMVIDDQTGDSLMDRNCRCCVKCCCHYLSWLRFQNKLRGFVTDPLFELLIILCILMNTAMMGVEYDGMPDSVGNAVEIANYVFTGVFTMEATFKITSMNLSYFRNRWNVFDFFLVICSLLDILLTSSGLLSQIPGMSAFRILRLFRVFRLAQSWDTMRVLLSIIFSTLGSLGNLTVVLILFIYIFAVIGLQLFSDIYTPENFAPDEVPRWNFIDFGHAMLMMFRVLCGEWLEPMWDCMKVSDEICMVVFLPTLFIGNFMVLNLFLALLLNSFATDSLQKKHKTDKESNRMLMAFKRILNLLHIKRAPKVGDSEKNSDKEDGKSNNDGIEMSVAVTKTNDNSNGTCAMGQNHENGGSPISETTMTPVKVTNKRPSKDPPAKRPQSAGKRSKKSFASSVTQVATVYDCFPVCCITKLKCTVITRSNSWNCFPNWYAFRLFMVKLVDHKIFEGFILLLIAASSICLAFEDIYLDFNTIMKEFLYCANIFFCVVFALEMVMKFFAYGFKKYFSSFWTILDFFIVVVSIASMIAESLATSNISSLRSLRTLRAFRPLRSISRWQGMKIVVNALMFAIPAIINVLLVCFIFWLIFSILGVQLFKGLFYKCVDSSGNLLSQDQVPNMTSCLDQNYTWINSNVNFDNVGIGFVALLQVATFEGWMEVIMDAVDSREEKGLQPYREANMPAYIYFVIFIVVGAFFTLNLFIGVIIDNFNMLKKKYDGTYLDMFLTESQRNYYNTLKKLGTKKPQKTIKRPKNKFQGFFYDIAVSTKFEMLIVLLIFINMIGMAVEHYKQAKNITDALDIVNIIFTTIFTLEAIAKIIGMRLHYFRRMWNVFDFAIVVLSIIELSAGAMLADVMKDIFVTPTLLRVVRIFRIGRVLRLVKAAKGIRKLLFALVISVPALFNIGALLFLIIFIYAILGMSLFGNLRHAGAIDDLVNFETFERSVLMLFRLATSAGWNDVLEPMFAQPPDCNNTYWVNPVGVAVPMDGGDCGNPIVAIVYMMTFVFISNLLIINMYVAIILENFNQAHQQEEVGVTEDDFEMFYTVWERYDPHATQFVKYDTLSDFVADLDEPLGIPKPNEIALVSFDLPIVKGEKVHCLDVLMGLTKYRLGDVEMSQEFQALKSQMEDKFRQAFPTRVKTEVISSTIERKKQDVAAKTLQRAWRNHRAAQGILNLARRSSDRRRSISVSSVHSGAIETTSRPDSSRIPVQVTLHVPGTSAETQNAQRL